MFRSGKGYAKCSRMVVRKTTLCPAYTGRYNSAAGATSLTLNTRR